MALSVRERTKEIGVLRAIGLSRRSIFLDILLESLWISGIGFILGAGLGYLLANVLDMTILHLTGDSLPEDMSFIFISIGVILQVSFLALGIGIVSGLLPAIRAVRLNISEVIRGE